MSFWGLVSLSLSFARFFEEAISPTPLESLDVEADVMLTLDVQNLYGPGRDGTRTLYHELRVLKRGFGEYILENGIKLPYVELSGVHVRPDSGVLATIEFLRVGKRMNVYDLVNDLNDLVQRHDTEFGDLYARKDAITAALDSIDDYISQIEKQPVSVPAVCPNAKSDRCGTVTVSVLNYWNYFKAFNHDPNTAMRYDNYHTRRDSATKHLAFVRGRTKVIPLHPCRTKGARK